MITAQHYLTSYGIMDIMSPVVLKPQDVMVAMQVALLPPDLRFSFAQVAEALAISKSEVHAAVGRCLHAKLLMRSPRRADMALVPNRTNLLEFLLHGVKYAFPPTEGGLTRGIPTGYASPVLSGYFAPSAKTPPPVWADPMGEVRGRAFEPLYPSVPKAASRNPRMYAALSLLDAVRGGGARDREIAERLLAQTLAPPRPKA